jgi:hypothetical protein
MITKWDDVSTECPLKGRQQFSPSSTKPGYVALRKDGMSMEKTSVGILTSGPVRILCATGAFALALQYCNHA